jgi:hypothetical protein
MTQMTFEEALPLAKWMPYTDQNCQVEIICQLATGERLSLYQGTLIR